MRAIPTIAALRTTALALGACVTLAACAGSDDNAAADSAAMMPPPAMGAMGDSAGMAGGMNDGSMAMMSDANILSEIGMSNAGEIGAGKVAQTKATNAAVKAFAAKMVTAHTAAQGDADKLATRANITPMAPPGAEAMRVNNEQMMNTLNSTAKGAMFDRAYIDGQVSAHMMVLTGLKKNEGMAQNAELKAMITRMIPVVQGHHDEAVRIQSQLTTAS